MSFTTEVTLWCDREGCWAWTTGDGALRTVAACRRSARREGWTGKGGHDVCPECTAGLPISSTERQVARAERGV